MIPLHRFLRSTLTISLLPGLLLAAGCVTSRDFQNLQKQVYSLQKTQRQNNQELQSRLNALEKQVGSIEDNTMERISKDTGPVRSRLAEMWSQIESLKVELARVKGNQDSLQSRLDAMAESSSNSTGRLSDLEQRVAGLESDFGQMSSQLGLDLEQTGDKQTGEAGSAQSTEPSKQTPRILYDNALRAFQQREYQKALDLWSQFVKDFPEHELVPNAYFWQGESYYQMQDYARAVLKYQEVIENYAKSTKYPAALLKQGISFYELDKNKAGRVLLEELISKYGDTAEAKRAKRFLQTR